MAINWTCPFCDRATTLVDGQISRSEWETQTTEAKPDVRLWSQILLYTCPNDECKKTVVDVWVCGSKPRSGWVLGQADISNILLSRRLMPKSSARPLHTNVPEAIVEDFEEAHNILYDSPKSSAALARRAIQGMIRDFQKISKGRLIDEIRALEAIVEPEVWSAIDAVRKVGNIGAHMEKNVNIIIEVEPHEAEVLLSLVSLLSDDWYKARADRADRLANITAIGDQKSADKAAKNGS